MRTLSRRAFVGGAVCGAWGGGSFLSAATSEADQRDVVDRPLSPWRPGSLDIHHIATGRGDATLIVAPDGTSILVDAGAVAGSDAAMLPARPGGERRPGEWIGRYIRRRLADTRTEALDVLLVTHLHPDHIGGLGERTPPSPSGRYRLTGITDVAQTVRVRRLIDAQFPDYGYPVFEDAAASQNYVAYVRDRAARGESVERFKAGRADQIVLAHRPLGIGFEVRNLAAGGVVWKGRGEETVEKFPARERLAAADYPNVNAGSLACRLRFGAFGYFFAGDLTDWADAGARPWMDALTPAVEACGKVDVAVVPHHGLFDAAGSAMVRALAARVWVISAWHASHPSISTLERLFNERLYPGARSVYTTGLSPAADLMHGRLTRRLASREGHIVIRVAQDGATFRVVITSNEDESDRVLRVSEDLEAGGVV